MKTAVMRLRSIRWKLTATIADRKIAFALIDQRGALWLIDGGREWRVGWPKGHRGD